MSEDRRRKFRASLTWGKRILLALAVIIGLCWFVLEMVERSKDPIRMGLEDYLKQVTGENAEITDITKLSLTPTVLFDMKGIIIRRKEKADDVLVRVERAQIALPFWHILFGRGDYYRLELQNMAVATAYWLPKRLDVRFAGISDPSPDKAAPNFVIDGRYNDRPLLVTAEMRRRGSPKHLLYGFHNRYPVTFKVGDLEAGGSLVRGFTSVAMEEVHLTYPGHEAVFEISGMTREPLHLSASGLVDGVPFNAVLTKEGESRVLNVVPETEDGAALKMIETFAGHIRKELGLAENDKSLTIRIAPPNASAQQDSNDR